VFNKAGYGQASGFSVLLIIGFDELDLSPLDSASLVPQLDGKTSAVEAVDTQFGRPAGQPPRKPMRMGSGGAQDRSASDMAAIRIRMVCRRRNMANTLVL